MTMAVGGVGQSSGPRSSALSLPDNASLHADDAGSLTLQPVGNAPLHISKGNEGRYHVEVGGQDIAFTPEQMNRLNIKTAASNPFIIDPNVDIPVKVNGKPFGPDGPIKGKGFESIPEVAGDRYVAGAEKQHEANRAAPLNRSRQAEEPNRVDANRAVAGNNWDSVGVPEQAKQAEGPEAKKPEKQGKRVDLIELPTNGEEKVEIDKLPDAIRVKMYKNDVDLWQKMCSNMASQGRDGLENSEFARRAASGEIAGMRADELGKQLDQLQAQTVQGASATAGGDNRDRG